MAGQNMEDGPNRDAAFQRSEATFRRAISLNPEDIRAYVSIGTLYVRQNRFEDARAVFEEGCAVCEGNNAYIWTAIANLERTVRSGPVLPL